MADSCVGHCDVSVETRGRSFVLVPLGSRRESEWMFVIEEWASSVERIWEPCEILELLVCCQKVIVEVLTTRPVAPTKATEVMVIAV